MHLDPTANTADELARIGNALFKASKQKCLDERVQLTRLLEALSPAIACAQSGRSTSMKLK
jgi:hypothetical protein